MSNLEHLQGKNIIKIHVGSKNNWKVGSRSEKIILDP